VRNLVAFIGAPSNAEITGRASGPG
jgi:hypothetical protein